MKNTIIMQLAEIFCPHYCISCGKAGGILCGCCKKYIMAAAETKCLCCERELIGHCCPAGCLTGVKQFCLGRRKGVLSELIKCYKYHSVRSAAFAFAEMLD